MTIRLPAEWEEQDGVLLAWPHEDTDWQPIISDVKKTYLEIVKSIKRFEKVILVGPDPMEIFHDLESHDLADDHVQIFKACSNDTWARDFGPITVQKSGRPVMLDFGFNGWGLKYAADHDNCITRELAKKRAFKVPVQTMGLILEGGSIESDGQGTLMSTANCLLNRNRNPQLTKTTIETELSEYFGVNHFLWLHEGNLAGDDTDSHIDTLARLCPNDVILYVSCQDSDDEHYAGLKAMEDELKSFRTPHGKPYELIALPFPAAKMSQPGNRLPATYANFLIINNAVLVPTYDDSHDEEAIECIKKVFPDREIIDINCSSLIQQNGSLHCITMQLPKGTLWDKPIHSPIT